jgi:hypothetical protein
MQTITAQTASQAIANDPANAHLIQQDGKPEWRGDRLAAENIRRGLKKAFPGYKFSVTASSGAVRVKWTDGPTVDAVKKITNRHEIGSFNGMDDLYEYSSEAHFAEVFGGTRYVFESREVTPEAKQAAFAAAYPNGLTCDGQTFTAIPASTLCLSSAQEYHLSQPWRTTTFPAPKAK